MQANDIARYFLAKADPEIGDIISNLKLQKLCYYAQGFHLALLDRPLFQEPIEAWQHGPVVPELYHAYKHYGSQSIPAPTDLDLASYPEDVRALLDEVYSVYGQYSAWKLRNMTHEEQPWIEAHQAGGAVIEHAAMQEYFKTLLQ
ncbi:MAG: hypothetical protein DI601_18320 [Azospirillum brasilense]|nr:MAG: hypothetical protein DI601_18320 [Azospirillum brasilense]